MTDEEKTMTNEELRRNRIVELEQLKFQRNNVLIEHPELREISRENCKVNPENLWKLYGYDMGIAALDYFIYGRERRKKEIKRLQEKYREIKKPDRDLTPEERERYAIIDDLTQISYEKEREYKEHAKNLRKKVIT